MRKETTDQSVKQDQFYDLLKRNYEKGITDTELTVERLLEDLKTDIKKVFTR